MRRLNLFIHSSAIFLLIGFFSVLYSFIAITKYLHFQTGLDLAIYVQTFWFYTHLKLPHVTLYPTYGDLVWADHFSPSLLLLTPFYLLWKDPRTLLILQSLVLCSGAYPIYRFAKERLSHELFSLTIAVVYLTSFALQFPVTFDFHMATMAASFLPWILWCLFTERWLLFAVLSIVGMGFKEDMPIYIAILSFYMFITKRNRKMALLLFILSTGYIILVTQYLMPQMAHEATKIYSIPPIPKNPYSLFRLFTDSSIKTTTLFFTNINSLFLPLFSGSFILLPIVHFFINFANPSFPERWGLYMHYRSYLASIMAFGSILGILNLIRQKPQFFRKTQTLTILSFLLLGNAVVLDVLLHLPLNTLLKKQFYYQETWIHDNNEVIKRIPPSAYLLTTNHLFPQLAYRQHIYQYPHNLALAEYILFDTRKNQPVINYWLTAGTEEQFQNQIKKLLASHTFILDYESHEAVLLKRNYAVSLRNYIPE